MLGYIYFIHSNLFIITRISNGRILLTHTQLIRHTSQMPVQSTIVRRNTEYKYVHRIVHTFESCIFVSRFFHILCTSFSVFGPFSWFGVDRFNLSKYFLFFVFNGFLFLDDASQHICMVYVFPIPKTEITVHIGHQFYHRFKAL